MGDSGCANVGDPVLDQLLVERYLVGGLGWGMGCTNVFGPFPFFVDFSRWDDGRVGIVGNGGSIFVCANLFCPLFLTCRSTQVGDRRWCCRCQRGVGRNARPPGGFGGFGRGWDGAGETGDIWLNTSPPRVQFRRSEITIGRESWISPGSHGFGAGQVVF